MADISKINAVALADIAKLDAVLAANIAKVNGLTFPAAGVAPPLDTYTGAEAAFSVRLLRTAYTGDCLRVRRSSDNTEQDIGFDSNGDLDTSALVTFVGSGNNGFVKTWYDQSGNGYDATQTTAGKQPKIYDSTTGLIQGGSVGNEKPAILFDGTNDNLENQNQNYTAGSERNLFAVVDLNTASGGVFTTDWTPRVAQDMKLNTNLTSLIFSPGITPITTATSSTTLSAGQYLFESEYEGTNLSVYIDGTQDGTATHSLPRTGACKFALGAAYQKTAEFLDGSIQELISYQISKDTVRGDIATALNDYFNIY